ncbi:MAG: serine/threonine protein kinase [Gemmatimonadaceae bacterium]|nr:serine/threonine protein kinase [Gemmatimonadaceae bacterium]
MKHGSLLHLAPSVKDLFLPDRYLGQQIGKYRVTRLLGGGAFAWVYEAVDRDLEIPVALKILRPEFAGDPDQEMRFRREASTAARLRHANIVTVRDVGKIDGASFVAMDLLPLSLARRLELLGRLPEPDVVRIGLDVAGALAIAHAGGVVHRDIKPDNILIGSNAEAVVADFGLARALTSNDPALSGQQVMGTPHYFSPEQARGLELDGRSDLYALGVTLFRAVTGRLPFEGDDWYAVAKQHVESPAPTAQSIIPDVSDPLNAVIAKLLAKDPNDRYPSAIHLADALAALPTAPTARAAASRNDASETMHAAPPVAAPVVAPRRARGVVAGALSLAALAAIGWQLPSVRAWFSQARGNGSTAAPVATPAVTPVQPTALSTTDTTPADVAAIPADSARLVDSLGRVPIVDSVRKQAVAAVRSTLVLRAPDSAMLYVDDALVGRGTATISRPGAARVALRAVIADAPLSCVTAKRDSVVRLAVGEKGRTVVLAVRTCLTVRFNVTPDDARVRFESLDGGAPVEVAADVKSVMLPEGRYEVRASAARCVEYRGDIMTVRRGLPVDSLTRRIPLDCR